MALATSMPLLGDLTMKFSRHSLHDSFQLPTSFNFYHCFEQAKDIALYNRFFATRGEDTIFEFTGSVGGNYWQGKASNVGEEKQESKFSYEFEKTAPIIETKETAYANSTQSSTCTKLTHETLNRTSPEESDDDDEASSDEEELVSYFSGKLENCGKTDTSRITSHNRKRSIELEESFDVKRCCRPQLNFEKMQLERGEDCTAEDNTNFFRPISSLDL